MFPKGFFLIPLVLYGLILSGFAQHPSSQEPPPRTYANQDTIPYDTGKLVTFATLLQKLRPLQQEQQEKMEAKIRETGMSAKKYREVHMAQMSKGRDNLSSRAVRKYKKATRKIQQVRKTYKKKMDSTIRKEGMEPELYNEMVVVYKKNKKMQKAVKKLLEKAD